MTCLFKAFRAVDNSELAKAFHDGHTKILTDLGISSLTSNYPSWMNDPNVLVIIVTNEEEEVIGGIRVHKYDGSFELPIASAIKYQDPKIQDYIELKRLSGGVAESCGLWNSKKVYGRGLSPLLARCSVALTSAFDVNCLICFSAPYTLRMIKTLGFTEILEVGDNGRLPYPTEKFISSALVVDNIYTNESGTAENLDRIQSLIENPVQTVVELSQGKEVNVVYNLIGKHTYTDEKKT